MLTIQANMPAGSAPTMTSLELVDIINAMRESGRVEQRHDNFMAKLEKHPGIDSPKFLGQYRDASGRMVKCYNLPKREAELMVMSESLAVQTKVYDRLVDLQVATQVPVDPLASLPVEQRALVEVMIQNAEIKQVQARQGESLLALERRVEESEQTHLMLTRPVNAESIVHIRVRINRLYGLPIRIVDEIIRQSPYAPKPAGLVKNVREEAQGSSYAVYWTKDVNSVFARFVAECTEVTQFQATHPLISGRFKLKGRA